MARPALMCGLVVFSAVCVALAEDDKPETEKSGAESSAKREPLREALAQFNPLIGGWRGIGQPLRNSNKDAWKESGEWVWELKKDDAAIRYVVKDGKLLRTGLLTWDPQVKEFVFNATLPDESERNYRGKLSGNKLTLQTAADDAGNEHQIMITLLNEKRTLVLFQTKGKAQQQFNRVAEVGYTREGTKLAEDGVSGPECIVTGGKGTISIAYKGKTYWVCCTGCRDAFNDDPEGIIAEAAERAAKKKSGAKPDDKPKS
jgi:YHS domain-containing protein